MKYYVTISMQSDRSDLHGLEERLDLLMDTLANLESETLYDIDLGASLTEGWVDATMTVEEDDPSAGIHRAFAALRSALHEIGDATPGWENIAREAAVSAQPERELADA